MSHTEHLSKPALRVADKPKAILFDLDGTLLDTAADLHMALNQVLRAHKLPLVELEDARPVASHGSNGLLRLGFGDGFHDDNRDALRAAFLAEYAKDTSSRTVFFEGIEALLEQLTAADIAYGIVTNKPTQFTHALLPQFPLLADCRAVVCGDTLAVAKPDPAPILHAAKLLGVESHQCWYVGDAERDIQAGRAAGMFTVLANYGYIGPEDTPAAWLADAHIDHALALTELWR